MFGLIKFEEFLDQLRICWFLKRAKRLAVICLIVSIPVSYSESRISTSLKVIFGGVPVTIFIPLNMP
jgi:hypothetical protein